MRNQLVDKGMGVEANIDAIRSALSIMKLTLPEKPASNTNMPMNRRIVGATLAVAGPIGRMLRSWLLTWELYPILLIAAFLRLYRLDTSEFDDDQAMIFRMAHDAIHYGLLPATSNIASVRIANPPAVIYLLMLPAALSSNPLWGAVLVGLLNTAAVVLTYVFTRRYYGRLAGVIAALLYATASKVIVYSRFLWQQNMIAPLVVLFMFALFWGVVERRKGWLFPALLLLGVLFQLHESTVLLIIPLMVAIVLAPGTLRWRDLALGILSLSILFSSYLLWEISAKFHDLSVLLKLEKLPAKIDNQALSNYRSFFSPYGFSLSDLPPTHPHSLVAALVPLLRQLRRILLVLVLAGFATLGLSFLNDRLFSRGKTEAQRESTKVVAQCIAPDNETQESMLSTTSNNRGLLNWWTSLRNTPYRCGLLLLFVWQVVPLLILSHHSVPLYPYYLLMLMPGPFILIGLFFSKVVVWLQRSGLSWRALRYAAYTFASLVIIVQLIGSTAGLLDATRGTLGHGTTYNDLESLQHALTEADELAQQHHFNRVYIATDSSSETALRYLAEQLRTPTTLFDASRCLVLPDPADGSAVLLVGPADGLATAMLSQFATATLVARPPRLGSVPFQLYIVRPLALNSELQQPPLPQFVQNLQLLNKSAHLLRFSNLSWLVTDWRLLRSEQPGFRVTYNYILAASPTNNGIVSKSSSSSICTFTAIRTGDQLLVAFNWPNSHSVPASLTITASFSRAMPYIPSYGPLHLETIGTQISPSSVLQTMQGSKSITLPIL